MKKLLFLTILFLTFSANAQQVKPKAKQVFKTALNKMTAVNEMAFAEVSCDTTDFPLIWVQDYYKFQHLALQCPQPAEAEAKLVVWNPVNKRFASIDFPVSAGSYLYYNGTGLEWNAIKKVETFSGNTNSSGNYTVTFSTPYSVAPNIQANVIGGTALYRTIITSISTTGFTVQVVSQNTNTLLGIVNLVSSTTPVNGASVDVLITEK